jgi:sec-independent protein translocase protein TatA
MPGFIGVPELLLLGLVALLLFGPKRLPEMGRGLGKGMREFKDSISGVTDLAAAPVAVESTAAADVAQKPNPGGRRAVSGPQTRLRALRRRPCLSGGNAEGDAAAQNRPYSIGLGFSPAEAAPLAMAYG